MFFGEQDKLAKIYKLPFYIDFESIRPILEISIERLSYVINSYKIGDFKKIVMLKCQHKIFHCGR